MNNLEATVLEYQQAGKDWIEAKLISDQLEEDQKSFLAAIVNQIEAEYRLEKVKTSEAMMERVARGSEQYRSYIKNMCLARAEMLRKKIRFDALEMLFRARQSELSFEKVKAGLRIDHLGG